MINPIGYFRIHRELYHKPIWKQSTPEQKVILMALLAMAWFKPNEWEWNGKKFNTEPGQFITSLQSITEDCGKGITVKNVRTALKRFEKLGFLANESTKTGRLITIANWSLYQAKTNEVAKETANGWQTGGKEVATKEERKKETKKENKPSQPKWTDEDIEFKLSLYLYNYILKNNPGHKKPNLQAWSNEIDKMIRLDERKVEDIKKVIVWCQSDSFWIPNILSTSKLRKKYDQLYIKMKESKKDDVNDKGRGHLLGAVCNTGKITRRPKRFEDVVVDD